MFRSEFYAEEEFLFRRISGAMLWKRVDSVFRWFAYEFFIRIHKKYGETNKRTSE